MYETIKAPWVLEVISEKFDNALELMPKHTIIYGGAVRDAFAEMELLGDLDIASPSKVFGELDRAFRTSNKWLPSKVCAGKYKTPKLTSVKEFVNMYGAKIQIMRAVTDVYMIAETVDIRCCGMAITHTGEVLEVVPQARQDCIDKVLNLSGEVKTTIELERIKDRIKKLVGRGWKSNINIAALTRAVSKIEKRKTRPLKKSKHIMPNNDFIAYSTANCSTTSSIARWVVGK